MQVLRKILFYIFAAAYIIICPLLILYAFGYIYEPGTEKGYAKTGLIYVSTAPAGADVYLNESLYTAKTPTQIRELIPGQYNIALELDGYRPWRQAVPVDEEKATVLDKVILIPRERTSDIAVKGAFECLYPVPGTGYLILLARGRELEGALVFDVSAGKPRPLSAEGSPFGNGKVRDVLLSEGSSYILLRVTSDGKERFLWKDISQEKGQFRDITGLVPEGFSSHDWSAGRDKDIFFLTGGSLVRVDADAGAVYPGLIKGIKGFGLHDGSVYAVDDSNKVAEYGYDGQQKRLLLDDRQAGDVIFRGKEEYKINVISDEIIIFLGNEGSLSANKLPYRFADSDVVDAKTDSSGEKVLVVSRKGIGILDFAAESTGAAGFETGPSMTWVYSGGHDIEQASWVYKDSHVIFRDGETVYLVELDPYGNFPASEVLGIKNDSAFSYSETTGKIYFIGGQDNTVREAEIVPVSSISAIPFPELEKESKEGRVKELTAD